ncbi:MAG TPA: TAXI family TRAP transporter solute-binding subunit [Acidobacteriota bacterium]|nr:TAXI family TRAP transporter solute-binding subunit [Acidobacteriota bacterium]
MRGIHFWIMAAAAALLLSACGGGESDGQGGQRRFVSIGSAPPGGAFFVVGSAVAEVLNANAAGNWEVNNEATSGSQENIRRLDAGDLDLAVSNAAITYSSLKGGRDWDKAYEMRSLMTLAPNIALFITSAGSSVRSVEDLKGKRVVVGPPGAGFEHFLAPLLEAHGVSYDDFTPLYNSQAGAVDMLSDGSASAAFLGGAVPTASITQASASMDIYFVPYDEEAKQRAIRDYPFFTAATIPAATYRNQEEPFQGLNVGSMHLITAASVDEELVYQITKTLYENRQQVAEKHPAGRAINPENVVRNVGTPFHPGAIRYYREIGIWPEAEAEDQSQSEDR